MQIAKELSYTLAELLERITPEELILWNAFLMIEREEQAKAARSQR